MSGILYFFLKLLKQIKMLQMICKPISYTQNLNSFCYRYQPLDPSFLFSTEMYKMNMFIHVYIWGSMYF